MGKKHGANCKTLTITASCSISECPAWAVKAISPKLLNRIVFITGDTVNQATNSFLSSLPNPVLSKPFDFRELEQWVVSVIGQ